MPSVAVLSCFVVLYLTLLSFPVEAVDDANDDQYAFLTDLYKSTSGEMWKNNTNWLVRDDDKGISLCNWYGVSCSGKWVDGLDLSNNALGGPLPDKWERLPYLNSLDLSSNKFVLSSLSSMPQFLIYFNFSGCWEQFRHQLAI